MAGRNAQPIDLLQAKGKSHHITKAEAARRKSAEIKIKNKIFKASEYVMQDQRALQEFKRLKKLYKDIDFIGSLDEHIINQYCLSVAELDDLIVVMNHIRGRMRSTDPAEKEIGINKFLELDAELRMKRAEIVKLSDRLYLNPVARTKNVPKKEEKPKNPLADKGFGNV